MNVIPGLTYVSSNSLLLYYTIVALGAVYILFRFGLSKTTLLIVLVFWEGLFVCLSEVYNFSINYYKIAIFAYAVILFGPNILNKKYYEQDRIINITFILFSITFWISYFLNQQSFLTIASQYGYKYGFVFLFYHGIKDIHHKTQKTDFLARLLIHIVLLQVAFSIVKVLAIGGVMESIVGSVQYQGGGTAVAFPILGILFIWLNKRENMKRMDWLIAISVIIIAIASGKRTPVFVFPVVVALLMIYVQKAIKLSSLFKYLPIVLFIFYIGVKTNVDLNPEKSMWGSFNLDHVYSKVIKYNFGTEDLRSVSLHKYTAGRGGSLVLLFSPKSLDIRNISEFLFGHGLAEVAVVKYGRFLGGADYGIEHHGLMGAGARFIYTLGYFGFIFYLVFAFAIIRIINHNRFRLVVIGYYAVEFFLYYNSTLTSNAMTILFVSICLYSNIIFGKNSERGGVVPIYPVSTIKELNRFRPNVPI